MLMIMALLLATAAAPLLAESGPNEKDRSDDSSASNSESGNSGRNPDSAQKNSKTDDDKISDKPKTDITVKDGELKIEAKEGQDRIKTEVKASSNEQNAEVKVKTEARGAFANLISRLIASIFGKSEGSAPEAANSGISDKEAEESEKTSAVEQAQKNSIATPAPGITIDKTLSSGPGYPTGPLDISLPPTQLLLDRVGQAKGTEVKDRQYEIEFSSIPLTINGVSYTATEVKVISNLKTKAGTGQHQGTIDVDIDVPLGSTLPAGHITLEYKGSAIVNGAMISSGGVFKTSKMTGIFAGLVSEGTYSMSIIETGNTFGSPAIVSITTTSNT